jgi:hypothetical protein
LIRSFFKEHGNDCAQRVEAVITLISRRFPIGPSAVIVATTLEISCSHDDVNRSPNRRPQQNVVTVGVGSRINTLWKFDTAMWLVLQTID